MANYSLIHKSTFDGLPSAAPIYTLDIERKDYAGVVRSVTTASTILSGDTDDPNPGIKGSSLKFSLVNKGGELPLKSFYGEDDSFRVTLSWLGAMIWQGFLVQDDCNELEVDHAHLINLSANDNLGLLKSIPLDKSDLGYTLSYTSTENFASGAPNTLNLEYGFGSTVSVGDRVQISGGTAVDGIYTIAGVFIPGAPPSTAWSFITQEPIGNSGGTVSGQLSLYKHTLLEKTSLLNIIKNCLKETGLELVTNIYANLYSSGESMSYAGGTFFATAATGVIIQTTSLASNFAPGQQITITGSTSNNGTFTILSVDPAFPTDAHLTVAEPLTDEVGTVGVNISWHTDIWFLYTLVDTQTFLKSDTDFDDCYTVLNKILQRFDCALFQANGVWNIVRWNELRYYNNLIPGKSFDQKFNYLGAVTLPDAFVIREILPPDTFEHGINIQPENGLHSKINQRFRYDKETFNYKQPAQLLRNYNLQQLGNLLRTYTIGSGININTVKEYAFEWWTDATITPPSTGLVSTYFIRVVTDYYDNELERYVVVKDDHIHSYKIEATKGDKFTFSFDVLATYPTGGNNQEVYFYVSIDDGTTINWLKNFVVVGPAIVASSTYWDPSPDGWRYVYPFDNLNEWNNIEISHTILYDSILTFYLVAYPRNGINNIPIENHYKDIRLDYSFLINDSARIIGHTHTDTQQAIIKNKNERDIFIDSTPRNSIAGTLFTPEMRGLLQKRTNQWRRGHLTESFNLGRITTFEELFLHKQPRTILEGGFQGITQAGAHISLLSVFRYLNELNLPIGKIDIDFYNARFSGTLHEYYKDGETDDDLLHTYEFKYQYAPK